MAKTSFRKPARLQPAPPQPAARAKAQPGSPQRKLVAHQAPQLARNPAILPIIRREEKLDESVPAVYFAACRDHSLDGRRAAGWLRSLPPASCLRASPGRLSDDSNPDLLSGRQP